MDVPQSTLDKIESQLSSDKERKAEVLRVISTEHPHLTWEQVSDALYQLKGGEYHHVLERVQSLFPTGEYLSPSLLHTFILHSTIVLYCIAGYFHGCIFLCFRPWSCQQKFSQF